LWQGQADAAEKMTVRMGKTDGVVLHPLARHPDDRGYFEELIRVDDPWFKEGFGQLSHSKMYPGVVKAWHIHKTQIDWWCVAGGRLLVTLSIDYNAALDVFLKEGRVPFTSIAYLKRITDDNQWREATWDEVRDARYIHARRNAIGMGVSRRRVDPVLGRNGHITIRL
jgi:hypothetical protein